MPGSHLRTRPEPSRRHWLIWAVSLAAGVAIGLGVMSWIMSGDDDAAVAAEGAEATASSSTTTGSSSATSGSSSTTTPTTTEPDPEPVTIAFVGDIDAQGSLAGRATDDPDGFVGPFRDVIAGADLAVGNVEAAVVDGGTPEDKFPVFRAPTAVFDALRAGGFDLVTVANDHGMDYGVEGLGTTLAAAGARDDLLIGAGTDEGAAYRPRVVDIGGQHIAVLAATQVIDAERIESWTATPDHAGLASAKRADRLVAAVQDATTEADTVVVYLHWGTDGATCPDANQQELARALTEAGADVIVGTHTHRLQGAGMLDDTLVAYGLGNFLVGSAGPEPGAAETGVLLVEVDQGTVTGYDWRPGRVVEAVPRPLGDGAAAAAVDAWNGLRGCTGLAG